MNATERQDVYTRITNQILTSLEKGVRPWIKPWNAEHAAGRITRPLRHNGQPYSGINVLSLWASAMAQNFTAAENQGLIAVSDILSDVKDISFVRFGGEDVVRHKLVQRIVAAYDEYQHKRT